MSSVNATLRCVQPRSSLPWSWRAEWPVFLAETAVSCQAQLIELPMSLQSNVWARVVKCLPSSGLCDSVSLCGLAAQPAYPPRDVFHDRLPLRETCFSSSSGCARHLRGGKEVPCLSAASPHAHCCYPGPFTVLTVHRRRSTSLRRPRLVSASVGHCDLGSEPRRTSQSIIIDHPRLTLAAHD